MSEGGVRHDAAELGREDLAAWLDDQPDNYFDADEDLQRILRRTWGEALFGARRERLSAFGEVCARVDPVICEVEHRKNLPRIERWDGIGRRTEQVVYDESHHRIGRHLYGSGVVAVLAEPGNTALANMLLYLSNENGEAGHNCPIVCTLGLVRALQHAGSDELRARFLPGLLTADYDRKLDGAQFMTEVQGGSDVGANSARATPIEGQPGRWRIDGEKWFCSNASADLFLLTARLPDGADGTRGLGLFLVPRTLEDGSPNGFRIRRLKEKLGTRALPSAEIDFLDSEGLSVGPARSGFKTMMSHVINTSRLCNASGALSMARRALVVSWTFAGRRRAFGQPIRSYPLVAETLADMRSEHVTLLAGHAHLCQLRDRLDTEAATEQEAGFFRVALNLNKYRTAVSAGEIIRSGLELLAGNGTIETFSVIPRLLRDNVVYENWEGSHNTLMMQVLRDMARLGVGEAFARDLGRRIALLALGPLGDFAGRAGAVLRTLSDDLSRLATVGAELASLRMRPLSDRMAWLMSAVAYAEQAAWELEEHGDDGAQHLLEHFWARRFDGRTELPTPAYLGTLAPLVERV